MVSISITAKSSYEKYKILKPLLNDNSINIDNENTFVKINDKYIPIWIDGNPVISKEVGYISISEDGFICTSELNVKTQQNYTFINEIDKFDITSDNRTRKEGGRTIFINGYTKYPTLMSLNIIVLSEQVPDILESLKQNKNIQLFIQCNNQSNKAIYLEPIALYSMSKFLYYDTYKPFHRLGPCLTYKDIIEILNKMELLDPSYENYGNPNQHLSFEGIKRNYTKDDLIAHIQKSKRVILIKNWCLKDLI